MERGEEGGRDGEERAQVGTEQEDTCPGKWPELQHTFVLPGTDVDGCARDS